MSGQDKLERLISTCTARDSAEELKTYFSIITNIDLCDKDIGDWSVKALAKALVSSTTVTTISFIVSFYGNEIGAKGEKALADELAKNITITNINLNDSISGKKVPNC